MRNQKRLAGIGMLLTLPALAVCLSGIFKFNVPSSLIHPALVIGGLLAALAINLFPVASAHTHLENGNLVGAPQEVDEHRVLGFRPRECWHLPVA